MKKGFTLLMIICAALMALSCSKTKSYTDMLKDQQKAIDKLIANNNFEVLSSYPSNGVFGANQFVKLDNGVYLNVIDSGNGNRATMYSTDVLTRFTIRYFMEDTFSLSNYGPNSNGIDPVEFKYGYYTAVVGPMTSVYLRYLNGFMSEGFQTPLQYVGDRAKVKLIVPFQVGSSTDMSKGDPAYYEIVEYKFVD